MPTREQICALADAYAAAVSAKDPERVVALYSDNPTIEDPIGNPQAGRDAIRKFYEQSAGVDLSITRCSPVTVVGDHAAFQIRVVVRLPQGDMVFTSTDVITVDDQCRIQHLTAYPDREADPDDAGPEG
jgi:steroid Delta-isomerase